jgi:DNA repair protein RecO (recombination protein O)
VNRPRVYQTEAIILNRHRFGEADQLLVFYTPHLGKLRAVAKGALRAKSKLGGHLEPLCHSLLLLAEGKNLDLVTQCQTINSFLLLREDLWCTSCALYAAELVDCFTADNLENYPLYKLLLNTLNRLCQGGSPQAGQLALRYFELYLLNYTGYRPELQVCVNCQQPLEPVPNYFSVSAGGVLCPLCYHSEPLTQPLSVSGLKVLRHLQQNSYPMASRLRLNPELQLELERLMRSYINYLLEHQVRSAAWLNTLSRSQK